MNEEKDTKSLNTRFAPAERAGIDALAQQQEILGNQAHLTDILNSISTQVVILNKERQIVFGNQAFLDLVDSQDLDHVTGGRVGEVLGCIHSGKTEGGCGTTDFCTLCGAVNSMMAANRGLRDVQECRIARKEDGKPLDLRVMASPIAINEEAFTVFSILDIGNEKRKDALEKIFLHDLLNTAGGLRGFTSLLDTAGDQDLRRYSSIVHDLAERLMDEIEAHRQLSQAEHEELETEIEAINTLELLNKVRDSLIKHNVAREKNIVVDPLSEEIHMDSDPRLLTRVLGNMVKNALEAIESGESVSLACTSLDGRIRFSVHNPGVIPRDIRMQIFQRSFTTKGKGRGLGTYSIKLLSEHYLNGSVGFTSTPEEGTLFFAEYPPTIS